LHGPFVVPFEQKRSLAPTIMPSTSRRSSLFTPTATITAANLMRLFRRIYPQMASSQTSGQPVAIDRPMQERLNALVDVSAQP
jgi:hypothetical protein